MKHILIFGAGLSAGHLIKYLEKQALENDWEIHVTDKEEANLSRYSSLSNRVHTFQMDISNEEKVRQMVSKADLVISMLPAFMHIRIANHCLAESKSLFTASYVNPDIKKLENEINEKNLLFLFECGLDPGIDHMSAMQMMDSIREKGGKITLFESFTGGLVAPESDDNPWNYKFTWNPRNVVLAGHGSAVKFLHHGKFKYIPYHQIFRRTEFLDIDKWGRFEGYANRDSLKYKEVYKLNDIETLYRGTLRRVRFGRAWNVFVQLGMTDDTYDMENVENMTNRQFVNSFLPYNKHDAVELKLMHYMQLEQDSLVFEKIKWLGLFDNTPVGLKRGTPAQLLQKILEPKWKMNDKDDDMVVMLHRFGYELDGEYIMKDAWMVHCGNGKEDTAMAQTVGLPLAMAASRYLKGEIDLRGIQLPIHKSIYEPILEELKNYGIKFIEKRVFDIV